MKLNRRQFGVTAIAAATAIGVPFKPPQMHVETSLSISQTHLCPLCSSASGSAYHMC